MQASKPLDLLSIRQPTRQRQQVNPSVAAEKHAKPREPSQQQAGPAADTPVAMPPSKQMFCALALC